MYREQICKPQMGLFTPRQLKHPSEWLWAIPLVREEIHALSLQTGPDVLGHLKDWVTILEQLLRVEPHLNKEVEVFLSRSEEEKKEGEVWYPIKLSDYLYGRVEQLLYCQPLSEGELSQVHAGPGAKEFHQNLFRENPELHQTLFRVDPEP